MQIQKGEENLVKDLDIQFHLMCGEETCMWETSNSMSCMHRLEKFFVHPILSSNISPPLNLVIDSK